MAVTLMSVLIFGLLTMFSQVQRASHLGMAQVDLMESGRVTMQFINEEFERISAFRPARESSTSLPPIPAPGP